MVTGTDQPYFADPACNSVEIVTEDDDEPDADGLILARIEAEAAELADAIEAGDCDEDGNWRPYDRSYWPGHL